MINKKSSIGEMDANVILIIMYISSLVLYLLPGVCYFSWVVAMIVYIFESKNEFVKKQAGQAIMLFLVGSVFSLIMYLVQLALVPVTYIQYADITLAGFRLFLSSLVGTIYVIVTIIIFILSIIASIRVYNYNDYTMPIIGDYLDKFRLLLDKVVGNNLTSEGSVVNENSSNIIIGELIPNNMYKKDNSKNKKLSEEK